MSREAGSLYLLPNVLGDTAAEAVIPAAALDRARSLDHFIAENPKSARAFLKRIGYSRPLQGARIVRLDHNTRPADVTALLEPVLAGADAGLLSDAGLPAVADPGAALVRAAHEKGVRVIPLSGPSSIFLALAASGLEGQRFVFHGYLPVKRSDLAAALKEIERQSGRLGQTQIFIETPYRNDATLAAMLGHLRDDTLVCIAADLTLPSETVNTRRVAAWRRNPPRLKDRPAVFLVLSID
ncbi:MAG TPA: SAM-dependent methyltransferase [Burkholderiales bacterium]|nr:SAM-dependent methyltransferase [Burkholderiales bacterium]